MQKRVIVCGGAGFIGTHLVKRLKADGHYVRSLDRKMPEFEPSVADDAWTRDLRFANFDMLFEGFDEVYQLACEMGGIGYIMDHDNDAAMLRNSSLINLQVLEACVNQQIPKVFFASSACVYPERDRGVSREYSYKEADAYPADYDNEYSWEKIFSERLYAAYARNKGIKVRIGRFHNVYGPLGTWRGGREKAPAAMCRKVAEAENYKGELDIWGDGNQTRSFMYVDDAVEGAIRLMDSGFQGPVNLGSAELVTVDQLAQTVMMIANKQLVIKHVEGPIGVLGRNSDNTLILEKLKWAPTTPLWKGLQATYPWIAEQVRAYKAKERAA